MLQRLWAVCGFLCALLAPVAPAVAQGGFGNTTGWVQANCGSPTIAFVAGNPGPFVIDTNGNLCIKGSISITPSGTQNVNLTEIAGAAPSATNPLWVFPATGAVFPVSGTFTASNPVGITPTDHTITSATGASQQIMAANASRHSLVIVNNGNANCGVNPTGGTAAIGGAGTMTLAPLGAYTPRIPSLSAVTVICTAGQPIYGDDN